MVISIDQPPDGGTPSVTIATVVCATKEVDPPHGQAPAVFTMGLMGKVTSKYFVIHDRMKINQPDPRQIDPLLGNVESELPALPKAREDDRSSCRP